MFNCVSQLYVCKSYPNHFRHCLIHSERCIERGRMKCIQYWPENQETQQFTTVDVSHEETLEFEDHVERVFWLTHKRVRISSWVSMKIAFWWKNQRVNWQKKVKPWSQGWLIAAGAYPGFCSMKCLEVFLLPLDGMLVHCRSLPRNELTETLLLFNKMFVT